MKPSKRGPRLWNKNLVPVPLPVPVPGSLSSGRGDGDGHGHGHVKKDIARNGKAGGLLID